MRFILMLLPVCVMFVSDVTGAGQSAAGPHRATVRKNVALGRTYTLVPAPNYPLCTDPADRTQLTDGQYTRDYFWTQKSTVGWSHSRPVVITLDLEKDIPIRGLSFNTAAGVAGVEWPASILVLVSVDGRAYHDLGDLVTLSRKGAAPPEGKYAVHRFVTDQLATHGRYIKLIINPAGGYCFVDEIEVFRGDDAWITRPLPGKEIRYPLEYFADTILNASVKRRIGRDLETARAAILKLEAPLSDEFKAHAMKEVGAIEKAISTLPDVDPKTFKAVFPLNELHARVFALHGALRAALGRPPLVVWNAVPWDFLTPTELPEPAPQAEIAVSAMRGETRAGAVNLTNCTAQAMTVRLHFDGLPGGPTPGFIAVQEVAWTDTHEGTAVAAALPVVAPRDGTYVIHVPAGMTRQVWFTVTPRLLEPGVHRGHLIIAGPEIDTVRVPVMLRVFDLDFPSEPTLHVGGWDYTDADSRYGVTPLNRSALIVHLREHFVDSPWATSAVMPIGEFDRQGDYRTPPSTARFDTWLARWPGARRYFVFASVGEQIAGTKIGEPLFDKKVAQWIRFWVNHVKKKGLRRNSLQCCWSTNRTRTTRIALLSPGRGLSRRPNPTLSFGKIRHTVFRPRLCRK